MIKRNSLYISSISFYFSLILYSTHFQYTTCRENIIKKLNQSRYMCMCAYLSVCVGVCVQYLQFEFIFYSYNHSTISLSGQCPPGEHSVLYCPQKAEPSCHNPTVHELTGPNRGLCDVPQCFCNKPTVRNTKTGKCVMLNKCWMQGYPCKHNRQPLLKKLRPCIIYLIPNLKWFFSLRLIS